MSRRYVAGFLFGRKYIFPYVLMVQKLKGPEVLHGKWNAIGGKIEEGELPLDAMHREFQEEIGIPTKYDWDFYCTLESQGGLVSFYRVTTDELPVVPKATLDTREPLEWFTPEDIIGIPQAKVSSKTVGSPSL